MTQLIQKSYLIFTHTNLTYQLVKPTPLLALSTRHWEPYKTYLGIPVKWWDCNLPKMFDVITTMYHFKVVWSFVIDESLLWAAWAFIWFVQWPKKSWEHEIRMAFELSCFSQMGPRESLDFYLFFWLHSNHPRRKASYSSVKVIMILPFLGSQKFRKNTRHYKNIVCWTLGRWF